MSKVAFLDGSDRKSAVSTMTREELLARIEQLERENQKVRIGRGQRVPRGTLGSSLFPTASWDIEATGLKPDIDILLCATIKPWGGEPVTFRLDESPTYEKDRSNDKWLAKRIRDELNKYTIAIGYNTMRYDVPFVNSRLLFHREDIISPMVKHLDLIYAARFRMRLRSARMAVVMEHLQVKTSKTSVVGRIWTKAMTGDSKALEYIVDHNIRDTVALEEVAERLSKFIDLKFFLVR